MILELDCGNSFIKWRIVDAQGAVLAGGWTGSEVELLGAISDASLLINACRLVSVRSDAETAHLIMAINRAFGVNVCCARSESWCAGVQNGYADPGKLGVDRWLAVLGAWSLAKGPCLVLDLGTAITSDWVASDGRHLGGYICPGMPLLRSQLQTHTRRIRYGDAFVASALADSSPGVSTMEAVERGCLLMLRAFVREQVSLAREQFAGNVSLFLTGGDALLVRDIDKDFRLVPDLVLHGLALACPLGDK